MPHVTELLTKVEKAIRLNCSPVVPSNWRRYWRAEPVIIALLTLLALLVRIWALGSKGLEYDEAATAMIARAAPQDIIKFHWEAPFEHPPLWQIVMYAWSRMMGQSEAALRLLPALAGTVTVPLLWRLLRLVYPPGSLVRLIAPVLVALSPVLVFYSQQSRMYTIVVALAVASLYATLCLIRAPSWRNLSIFVVVNWLMLAFHYYSVLLVAVEASFFLIVFARDRYLSLLVVAGITLSVAPLALWALLSPGFEKTMGVVMIETKRTNLDLFSFWNAIWRDLTFGSVRWQPHQSSLGYLLLPFAVIGMIDTLRAGIVRMRKSDEQDWYPWEWLWGIGFVLPILLSMLLFQTLPTRYILFVTPLLYILIALGIAWLWRVGRLVGIGGLIVAGVVAWIGLGHYFTTYQRSAYREMASHLSARADKSDLILLEAPRQHLLAKYYLDPGLQWVPVPSIALPSYWPVTAPPVDPHIMDDELQRYLERHDTLWLILTSQDEVDRGAFVPSYLTAVSYKVECRKWMDVELCHFISPHFVTSEAVTQKWVRFGQGMGLAGAEVSLETKEGLTLLLAKLNWRAYERPRKDYRVTLRLLDDQGNVITQSDDFPGGPLLPPSIWEEGNDGLGLMALQVPSAMPTGEYRLVVGLYDPDTLALLDPYGEDDSQLSGMVHLAAIRVSAQTISLSHPPSDSALGE
ncbi:MAG: glycosyltransferase family 39 protein [Chloroflexota bacterium]|nr:glycosyltransferase family 39 protein [Chloroflexota bacterium]